MQNAQDQQHANLPSNLYKTELCRSFEETGTCRYGSKCQFAHGYTELRPAPRHPKYKTEICKTFHSIGTCPYGTRCRFIHTSPSDNINWITADVDNPLFDLNDKNAPEFDRSPNTIPSNPTYQNFMARLPPIASHNNINHHISMLPSYGNEPLLSMRAEIPRLETTPRVESCTLIVERPSIPAAPVVTAPAIPTPIIPTPVIPVINTSTTANTNVLNISSTMNNGSLTPPGGHKHRLPVFRELCHQSSVERLQQQVLDFVFEKEQ